MDNIKLSPKYGANLCIPLCFWCNREKNEILVLGKLENDAPARQHCCYDYEPCDSCHSRFAGGVLLVEVIPVQLGGKPAIAFDDNVDLYPSGRYVVLTTTAVNRFFKNRQFNAGERCFVRDTDYVKMLEHISETDKL